MLKSPLLTLAGSGLVALTVLLGLSATPQAATYQWGGGTTNITGTGAPGGGTGTWNASIQNWTLNAYSGSGNAYVAWPGTTNDNAVFGGNAGTVTLGAASTLGDLSVETSDYIFTIGGNITLSLGRFTGSALPSATFQATSGSRTLIIAGTGTATFPGRLRNGGGTLGLRLGASRELSLTASNNDYTGVTAIFAGQLNVVSLAAGGLPSSIGASSGAASNLSLGNSTAAATLNYLGAGQGTDRLFTLIGTSGTVNHRLLNNGSGPLVFSNAGSVAQAGTTNLARAFTLGGTNAQDNVFAPRLSDNGTGALSVVKADSGRWILTGSNNYTGTTTVGGGVLFIDGDQSSAGGAVVVSNGAALGGSGKIGGAVTFEPGAAAWLALGETLTMKSHLIVNSNTVVVSLPQSVPVGIYPLALYEGTLTGSFAAPPTVAEGSFAPDTIGYITTGSGSVVLHVEVAPPQVTSTTVDSSLNPSWSGKFVTLTAMVAPSAGSARPTGSVQFRTNGVAFGPPVAVGAGPGARGIVSVGTSALAVGTTTVSADYVATGNFVGSGGNLPGGQVVTTSPPTANSLLPYVANFPTMPNPLVIRDWKQTALGYHDLAFNASVTGTNLPLLYEYNITTPAGFSGLAFGLPSYVGSPQGGGEGLTALGAVLGGTLAGRNMASDYGTDRVRQAEVFYSVVNGRGLVLNAVNFNGAGSAWYDIFPSILFHEIGARYPGRASFESKMTAIAESWLTAMPVLSNNWEHTGFDFQTMTPTDFAWDEPDMAIGIGWLEYIAYVRTGDPRYLAAADACMAQMNARSSNPVYEVLGYYGPLLAARMNAELGRNFSVSKHLNWVFSATSAARSGWGCMGSRWGSYDAYGLMGSTTDTFGYAFSMNSYVAPGVVAPLVRYEPRYARLLGRWLLHTAANANLFYPSTLPSNMQSSAAWVQSTGVQSISYEGVRRFGATTPYATGDASEPLQDLNPYGAWGSGMMAALYRTSNVTGILRVDCIATEAFAPPAYPTFLYYNPHAITHQVGIEVGASPVNVYDLVLGGFVATNVTGTTTVSIPADTALVAVLCPSADPVSQSGRRLMVGGRVVDYWNALLDSDGDTLPDWWESRYFGGTTNALPEATGANQRNNLQNYRLGLDPTDPSARFRALAGRQTGTRSPQVTWSTIGGKRYLLEYTDTFPSTPTNYFPVLSVTETNVAAGAGGWLTFTDDGTLTSPLTGNAQRFYRVRLAEP